METLLTGFTREERNSVVAITCPCRSGTFFGDAGVPQSSSVRKPVLHPSSLYGPTSPKSGNTAVGDHGLPDFRMQPARECVLAIASSWEASRRALSPRAHICSSVDPLSWLGCQHRSVRLVGLLPDVGRVVGQTHPVNMRLPLGI